MDKIIEKQLIYGIGGHKNESHKKLTRYIKCTRDNTIIFDTEAMKKQILQVKTFIKEIGKKYRKKKVKKKKPYPGHILIREKKGKVLKVLFATTTNRLKDIVTEAAKNCNMPFSVTKWIGGDLTARFKEKGWEYLNTTKEKSLRKNYVEAYKKSRLETKKKIKQLKKQQKPDVIVIPDVKNNKMIWKEAKISGIPIIGVVNSDCKLDIEYPILGNDASIDFIYWVCNLISKLIVQEINCKQYRITSSKPVSKTDAKIVLMQKFTDNKKNTKKEEWQKTLKITK